MKQIIGLNKIQPKRQGVVSTPAVQRSDPKSVYIGDLDVPWNIGQTVFRLKAARDMTIKDATITAGEILSPSGAPVVMEAWRNGQYTGTVTLQNGANTFPSFPLARLDEIELRILVKGEHQTKTEVKGLWVLYCVL